MEVFNLVEVSKDSVSKQMSDKSVVISVKSLYGERIPWIVLEIEILRISDYFGSWY